MNILIVDDSDFIRKLLKSTLSKEGYNVTEASNAESVLQLLEKENSFDLILSDINMPGMTGLDMVKEIRSKIKSNALKIIMLTTESEQGMQNIGSELDIQGWIVKPFQRDALLDSIKKATE